MLQILVLQGHNHLDSCGIGTIFDVAFQQKVGGRDCNGSNFVKGQQKEPELVATTENQHDGIALFDSLRKKEVSSFIGGKLQVQEGEDFFFIIVVAPHQCSSIWLSFCILIHHIVGKIEIFWNLNGKIIF